MNAKKAASAAFFAYKVPMAHKLCRGDCRIARPHYGKSGNCVHTVGRGLAPAAKPPLAQKSA